MPILVENLLRIENVSAVCLK